MKKINTSLFLAACTTFAAHSVELPVDRLHASPSLSGLAPLSAKLAPSGEMVTYRKARKNDANRYDLWKIDIASGQHSLLLNADNLQEQELSDEEKARRERMRVYGSGVMSYQWSRSGDAILLPSAGNLYHYQLENGVVTALDTGEGFGTDSRLSPTGAHVSYIKDQNIHVYDLKQASHWPLTSDGGAAIKNGMAEFVAQEEMGRMTGYWWSPKGTHIAYLQVDESPVNLATRNEIYADGIKLIDQRYPAAGTNNVKVKLFITDLAGHKTEVPLGNRTDIYIPRVQWNSDGSQLTYQWQDRSQKHLELRSFELSSNTQRVLVSERNPIWINLHNSLRFLKQSKKFIWMSERNGFAHLYLYNNDGTLDKQLTDGQWQVNDISYINEAKQTLYFTGRKTSVLEKHLYKLDMQTLKITQISQREGMHSIKFAQAGNVYLDGFSSDIQPPQVSLHHSDGKLSMWLEQNKLDESHPLAPYLPKWQQANYGTLSADDGTALQYRIFTPHNFNKRKKYPVIVRVYGGPHAQTVAKKWSSQDFFTQYLLQQGYIVFQLDNRGSGHRGLKFEQAIYANLSEVELSDQLVGVEYLKTLPYVDGANIGIYGHSYGGYMSIMASFKAGDVFKAAVAGAPVTDWALYDTHYTERYADHPATNPDSYKNSSVFSHVDGYQGGLFIYHGMADDNVLFEHSTRLYKTLQDKGMLFEAMDYPGSKHSMRGNKVRTHMYKSITNFFDRKLKN